MTLAAGIALLVLVAAAIALGMRAARRPAPMPVAVTFPRELPVAEAPPMELPPSEPPPCEPPPPPTITWTAALTPAVLDEVDRLRLIDDLALLAAPWTVELLRRAHVEESSPEARARIETALASAEEPAGAARVG